MKTLFSRLIAGVVSGFSTRKTSFLFGIPSETEGSVPAFGSRKQSRLAGDKMEHISQLSTLSSRSGFTLVELMIVIAIIGVLAASLFPMMSGYMARARDTARMNELRQLSLALGMYKTDMGTYKVANTGAGGSGIGWINIRESGATKSLYEAFQELGYISKSKPASQVGSDTGFVPGLASGPCGTYVPPGYMSGSATKGQMLYFSDSINKFALSTHLERPTEKDITYIQTTFNGMGLNGTCERYGMNYAVEGSY